MCNPAVIPYVMAAVAAYGSYEQGRQAKKTSRYNARVMENEAIRTRNKGTDEENRHREKVQQLISQQRATLGASGVDIASGSPLQAQTDAELLGEVDSLRIRQNYSDSARAIDEKAKLTIAEGNSAYRKGVIGAVTAIGGAVAGNVSNSWYTPQSSAVTTTTTGAQANAAFGNIA
jgi:hypothetical protein